MFKLFYDDFYQMSQNLKNLNTPELHHSESGSYFSIEVPGYNKDNLSVEVKDNHLLIKGERELNFESGSPVSKSTISKKYTIGEKYDQEKIKAAKDTTAKILPFDSLEVSARKKVLKLTDDWFKRLKKFNKKQKKSWQN